MVAPLLHTRVRDSLDIAQAPEQVLAELERLTPDNFSLIVDDSDSDNMIFEMVRNQAQVEDIIISGMIRRWQGTDSRLDFRGEVTVPPPNPHTQRLILLIILALASILYWAAILPLPLRMISDTATFYVLVGIMFLLYSFVVYHISRTILMNKTNDRQLWKLQQEMASIVEQIRELQSDDS